MRRTETKKLLNIIYITCREILKGAELDDKEMLKTVLTPK